MKRSISRDQGRLIPRHKSEACSTLCQREVAAQISAMLDLHTALPQWGFPSGGRGHPLQPLDGVPATSLKGASFLGRAVRSQRRQVPKALQASRLVPSFRSGWVVPLSKAYLSLLYVELAPQFECGRGMEREPFPEGGCG